MIWYLIRTIKETISNKKFFISSLCLLSLIMIGAIYMNSVDSSIADEKEQEGIVSFGVVDQDQSIYSKLIVQYFQGTESFQKFAMIKEGTEEEMHQEFLNGTISAYLVVPDRFADSLMTGERTKIRAVINADNTVVSVMLSNMLDSYDTYITSVQQNSFALYELFVKAGMTGEALRKANFDTSIDLVTKALNREELFEKVEVTTLPHTPIYKYYIWALISLFVVYSSILSGLTFLKEISLGTYARLRIMGHSVAKVLGGVLFSHSIVWSVILSTVVALLCKVLKMELPVEGYLFLVLCILISNLVFCLFASVFRDKKTYMVVSNFGLLLMGILGGVVFPISVMPYRFLMYAKGSPNYWIIYSMIQFSNGALKNVLEILIGMSAAAILLFVITLFVMNRRKYIRIGGDYESF